MGAGEDHPREQPVRIETGLFQARLGKQVAGGRAGVDEGEGMPLEIGEVANTAVLACQDQALVGALPGLPGHRHGKGLDLGHRGRQHVRERAEVGHVQLAGAQGFDDAVVVGGDEGLHRHAELLLQAVEHLLAGLDHGLGVFGGDQADGQLVGGLGLAGGDQREKRDTGDTEELGEGFHGIPSGCGWNGHRLGRSRDSHRINSIWVLPANY
ncbi:hypothetical protein D3C84_647870 [compost metagenome]